MITLIGTTSTFANGGDTLTFPNELPLQPGDLLLTALHGVRPKIPDPALVPWWPLAALTYNRNFITTIWYRIAADVEPTVYGWKWPNIYGAEGTYAAFRGCDPRHPIGLVAGRIVSSLTGYQYATPTVGPNLIGTGIVAIYGADALAMSNPEPDGSRRWTAPPGMTEIGDVKSRDNCASMHWAPVIPAGVAPQYIAGFHIRTGGTAHVITLRAAP